MAQAIYTDQTDQRWVVTNLHLASVINVDIFSKTLSHVSCKVPPEVP